MERKTLLPSRPLEVNPLKAMVKVEDINITPRHEEIPSQKRLGMARVVKESHSLPATPAFIHK